VVAFSDGKQVTTFPENAPVTVLFAKSQSARTRGGSADASGLLASRIPAHLRANLKLEINYVENRRDFCLPRDSINAVAIPSH
jgi:hypothetical protein